MEIHFGILGPVRVRLAGRFEVDRLRPKERAVLGALLVNLESPMSIHSLVDLVWGETSDDKMPGNPGDTLETHCKRINKVLQEMDVAARIRRVGPTYRLAVDREVVDLYAFRSQVERARDAAGRGEHRRARDLAAEALALWRDGEPLAEMSGVRVDAWRRHVVDGEWIPANDLLLREMINLGEHARALARLSDLQMAHPDNLLLHRSHLAALYGMGRLPEAVEYLRAVYKRYRDDAYDEVAQDLRAFNDELRTRHIQRPTVRITAAPDSAPPFYQVPHDADDFTGRDVLLRKLNHLIMPDGSPRPGVVVLSGLAGMGKTALAVRWAHLRRDQFANGVAFLNLHGMRETSTVDSDNAVDELLRAWGVAVERIAEPARRKATLRQLLGGRATLVILDNVRSSDQVRDLLPMLSGCTVLITSRQRLSQLDAAYGSVRLLTVHALGPHHAADLLRARLDMPAPSPPEIRELVGVCGGSPLAVKLVAQYIATGPDAPLTEYLAELRNPDRILVLGADGDGADISLQAAFTASYRRLASAEGRMFRLLGLNPGPSISRPAAAALGGMSVQLVRDILDVLAGAHLVEKTAPDRYQLHDLLAAYAKRLATRPEHEAESNAAEQRLLDFYLHTADRAAQRAFPLVDRPSVPHVPDGVQPVEFSTEDDAIAWCARERGCLSAAVRHAQQRNDHRRACLITNMVTEMFKKYGHHRELIELSTIARFSAKALNWVEAEGSALNDIGYCHLELGENMEARKHLYLARYIAEQENSELGIVSSLCNLARVAARESNLAHAVELLNEAMEHARVIGKPRVLAVVMQRLGEICQQQRQREMAISYYQQAYSRCEEVRDQRGMGEALCSQGSVYYESGDYTLANAYGQRALATLVPVRDVPGCLGTVMLLAEVHYKLKNWADARGYARRAVALARRASPGRQARALHVLAEVCRDSGYPEAAREGWEQAFRIYADLGDRQWVQVIRGRLAELPENSSIFRPRSGAGQSISEPYSSRNDEPIA